MQIGESQRQGCGKVVKCDNQGKFSRKMQILAAD